MVGTEETIRIDNKEEIKTNVEEVSNINIKSRAVKMQIKRILVFLLKFRNFIRSPLKTCFGTISNQNTDKLSCLLDSIKTAQL